MLRCQSKYHFHSFSYRSEVKARQDVKPDIRQPPFTDYRQPPLDYRQPPGGDYLQAPPLDYRQPSPDTRQFPLSDYRQPQVPQRSCCICFVFPVSRPVIHTHTHNSGAFIYGAQQQWMRKFKGEIISLRPICNSYMFAKSRDEYWRMCMKVNKLPSDSFNDWGNCVQICSGLWNLVLHFARWGNHITPHDIVSVGTR